MSDRTCVLCPVYHPDGDPRDQWPSCDGDALRLDADLASLPALHALLVQGETAPYDGRWYAVVDEQGRMTGDRRRRDPLGAIGGAGPIRSPAAGGRVSGSRERSVPGRLSVVDLTGPARPAVVHDTLVPAVALTPVDVTLTVVVAGPHGPAVRTVRERRMQRTTLRDPDGRPVMVGAGDQVGSASVATVLDLWCRDWRDQVWPGDQLPDDTVEALTRWLRAAVRDGADRFSPLPDFAAEIRALRGGLMGALGLLEPRPDVMLGVPCRGCAVVSQIVAYPDRGYRECAGRYGCGLLYSDQEWREHLTSPAVRRMLPGAGGGVTQ